MRLLADIGACFGAGRSLDECNGLKSTVEAGRDLGRRSRVGAPE